MILNQIWKASRGWTISFSNTGNSLSQSLNKWFPSWGQYLYKQLLSRVSQMWTPSTYSSIVELLHCKPTLFSCLPVARTGPALCLVSSTLWWTSWSSYFPLWFFYLSLQLSRHWHLNPAGKSPFSSATPVSSIIPIKALLLLGLIFHITFLFWQYQKHQVESTNSLAMSCFTSSMQPWPLSTHETALMSMCGCGYAGVDIQNEWTMGIFKNYPWL